MADEVANLILERLRRIEEKLDREIESNRDMRVRISHVEEALLLIHRRLDRIEDRLDRIEKRVDLQEVR